MTESTVAMELRHIEAVNRLIGLQRRLLRPESLNDAQEVLTLVRSIVSGDSVVVSRKQLERWRETIASPIYRWLTPDTSKESKE
jgi:hypothetical protein